MYQFMFNNNYIMNPFARQCHCHCNCNPFGNSLDMLILTSMFSGMFAPHYDYVPQFFDPFAYSFDYYMPTFQPSYFIPNYSWNTQSLFTIPQFPQLSSLPVQPRVQPTQPSISVKPSESELPLVPNENIVDTGKLDKNFLNRVKQIARKLNCDYRDLLAVMNSESGLNKNAKNPLGAVGLIQFTDASIAELKRVYGINVTKPQILNMSAMEQLDLVEKYLMLAKEYSFPANAKLSAGDLYAIVFLPGRANREVLCRKGEGNNFYEGNAALDFNGDNKITKNELVKRVNSHRVNESIFA